MSDLKHAEVWRGGLSTNRVVQERRTVTVKVGGPLDSRPLDPGVSLQAIIRSKGGGSTVVTTFIPASEYDAIALSMFKGSSKAATQAFAKALLSSN